MKSWRAARLLSFFSLSRLARPLCRLESLDSARLRLGTRRLRTPNTVPSQLTTQVSVRFFFMPSSFDRFSRQAFSRPSTFSFFASLPFCESHIRARELCRYKSLAASPRFPSARQKRCTSSLFYYSRHWRKTLHNKHATTNTLRQRNTLTRGVYVRFFSSTSPALIPTFDFFVLYRAVVRCVCEKDANTYKEVHMPSSYKTQTMQDSRRHKKTAKKESRGAS